MKELQESQKASIKNMHKVIYSMYKNYISVNPNFNTQSNYHSKVMIKHMLFNQGGKRPILRKLHNTEERN